MSGSLSSLASLSTVITKGTTPTTLGYAHSDSGIPFLRVQNIFGGQVNFEEDTLFIGSDTHAALKRSQIQGGDVLVTIAGTIGRTGVVPFQAPSMNCNQAVAIIRPTAKVERSYLRHWLESQDARGQMIGSTVTGTISNLSLSQLGELKVPLPPLKEQRRIAAILDQAETLRTQRRQALAHLDSFTQSIFLDMFGDPVTNPKGWTTRTLDEVTIKVTDGEHINPTFSDSGMPIVMAGNVLLDQIDLSAAKRVESSLGQQFRKKCGPEIGDLLIVGRGATIGRLCRVNVSDIFCLMGSVILVKPDRSLLDERFLAAMLALPSMHALLYKTSGSSAQQAIYLKDVKRLMCPLPPLPLQQTFATRIQAIESLKTTHRAALAQLDALFASLQLRAFAGLL